MGFWEDVYRLREEGLIPRVWKVGELKQNLPSSRYAPTTITTNPPNFSITIEGDLDGGYHARKESAPKAWRLGNGEYQLIEDPDDDEMTQKEQREKALVRARELRAVNIQEVREAGDPPHQQLPGGVTPSRDLAVKLQDPQHLIASSYQEARRSGKRDWRRMTTAVLKNRLLDLTGRSFTEAQYGASSFMDFVSRYPNMLQVDDSVFPPIVELHGAEADRLSPADSDYTSTTYHIRSDLWQAVLDYSSGTTYVWDLDRKEARPTQEFDPNPIVDTVTADIQRQWRQEFLDDVTRSLELTHTEVGQTSEWIRLQLGTSRLPTQLIPMWNRFFRDKVLAHLHRWFSESGLEPPDDIASSVSKRLASSPSETEKLRELVLSVVRKMTHEELSGLSLPSEAVLRATKQSKL